jgi:hypothetical protein
MSFTHFASEGLQILEESIEHQPEQEVSYKKLGELLDLLSERDWLPLNLTAETYKGLLAPLFSKMLRPLENPLAKVSQEGITLDVIHQTQLELRNWAFAQRRADEIAPPPNAPTPELVNETQRPQSWRTFMATFQVPFDPQQVQSIQEMNRLMNGPVHLNLDARGALKMGIDSQQAPYDLKSLSQLNWQRLFIHLALRGYARDPSRALRLIGLSEDEFHDFYKDVRYLGEALHFLDPRQGDPSDSPIWATLFHEANLFTFRGNGDDIISFDEGVEVTAMVFSNGAINRALWEQIASDVAEKQKADPGHRYIGENDVFGIPMLDAVEFRKGYRAHFAEFYTSLPTLLKQHHELVEGKDPKKLEDFFATIERAGQTRGRNRGMIESGDLDQYSMILQYVEAIFAVYDKDRSGGLSADEIKAALPRFRQEITKRSPVSWHGVLEAALTYMAKEGHQVQPGLSMHGLGDLWSLLKWATYDRVTGHWALEEVRPVQMISLFADVRNADGGAQTSAEATVAPPALIKRDCTSDAFNCASESAP